MFQFGLRLAVTSYRPRRRRHGDASSTSL